MRLGATPAGGKAKLGAKKAGATINFEEAERKAKEEEERIKQLGYDAKREAEEQAAREKAAREQAVADKAARQKGAVAAAADAEDVTVGVRRLGFGQIAGMNGADAAKQAEQAKKAAARRAAGGSDSASLTLQMLISIVMNAQTSRRRRTHETNSPIRRASHRINISVAAPTTRTPLEKLKLGYSSSPAPPPSHRTRCFSLYAFNGRIAEGSAQYFGIDEEEADAIEEGILGVESLSGLETQARKFVQSAMNQAGIHDVSSLQDAVRTGALKVRCFPFSRIGTRI